METKKNKTNKGWHENRDVLSMKAPRHQEVALKNKFDKEQISDATDITPHIETATLRFDETEKFPTLARQYEVESDILLEIYSEGDDIVVEIPVQKAGEFVGFLAARGIQVKDTLTVDDAKTTRDTDNKDVVIDSSADIKTEVDKIIAGVQHERSKRAIGKDSIKISDKENARELITWVKNPGKFDLKVDTFETE